MQNNSIELSELVNEDDGSDRLAKIEEEFYDLDHEMLIDGMAFESVSML